MGCQIATVAMVLGVTYEQAVALYEFSDPEYFKGRGLGRPWAEFVLADVGCWTRTLWRSRRVRTQDGPTLFRDPWPPEPFADVHWCEVQPVENAPAHCVVLLRDGTVLDPATAEPRRLSDYAVVMTVTGVIPPPKEPTT